MISFEFILFRIKDKINHPPEKRDFQKVSHNLARFIKLKESAKGEPVKQKNTQLKRVHIGNEDKPENYKKAGKAGNGGKGEKGEKNRKPQESRNNKEFTNLKQGANETNRGFMRRVNRVTQDSVEEAKFEAKYGVEVVRNSKTGEIKLKKKPKNEIDEHLKQNMENQKRLKKGGKAIPTAIVLAPEEKKKLIKAMLAEKKQKQKEAKEPEIEEFKRDEVKFGEVVNAPPQQLTVPRRAKQAETVPRVRNNFQFKYGKMLMKIIFVFKSNFSPERKLCYCILSLMNIRTRPLNQRNWLK